MTKPKREWIPTALRRKVQSQPCAICGIPFGIHCDHIIPVARGGKSVADNLQPLCRDCNYAKKHLKDNDQARAVIASRGYMHFLTAFYRHDTRYINSFDAPTLHVWASTHPMEVLEASRLYMKFSEAR